MNRIKTLCASFVLSCIMGVSVFAQGGYEVKGVVVDAIGPIIGATVIEQGTTNGVSTGLDGDYVLTVSSADAVVEISCIGYASQTFVASQVPATVTLSEDALFLDDVVVIGYGTVKKGDMTGSVGTVKADEINKGMIASPADLLKGKSAGVVVTPGSGQPGSGSTIRIRGGSSLNASNDPLIIVDGLPVSNDGISGMGDVLSSINPNDIESFSVLKDASATAIYGSRASNGVILITTKKGAKTTTNVPQIHFDFQTSVSHVTDYVDVLTGDQMRALAQERFDKGLVKDEAFIAALGKENTNWQKEIYQIAPSYEGNLSLAGRVALGNAGVLPYRVSGGFLAQDGVLKTDHMNRGTVAVNISPVLFDNHLTVNLNGKGVFSANNWAETGAIGAAVRMNPTLPVYDNSANGLNGYYIWRDLKGNVNTMATQNPVALLMEKTNKSSANRFIGNAQFDYKFHGFEDLRFNLNLGIDYAKSGGFNSTPTGSEQSYHDTAQSGSGYREDYSYKRMDTTLEAYLAYNKDINKHHIDAMVGYSWQHFLSESDSYKYRLTDNTKISGAPGAGELFLVSFFGRVNYSYDNRYMVTATLRRDGTSRFQNNKWGLFPSVALGWNIANEGFLKDNEVLTTLKLRASWGQTGQQAVGGYYSSMAIFTTNQLGSYYNFGDKLITPISPLGYNADLKWETTTTYNVGLDFGFLDDRITAGFDIYQRETTDMLNYIPIPALSNLTNYLDANIGSLVNKGIEFEFNATAIDTKDWTWQIGANVAYNNTIITKLTTQSEGYAGVDVGGIAGGTGNTIQKHQVGYAPYTFFLYEQVYDKDGRPIEGEYVDRDGNGVVDEQDRYYSVKPAADWTFGFNTTLSYKNWTLAASGHGSLGNWMYNNVASDAEMMGDLWINNFSSNRLQSALNSKFENACYLSDYYLQDASFFKFDNITLGYTFPKIYKSAKLDRAMGLNVFATVQNVATITKYTGIDPEISGGIDNVIYPRPRTYVLGIKLNF